VIAGYPWFADWGRDSFIALPGLTLATHRHAAARAILDAWAQWIDAGLMPNQFPEGGDMPEYNSADAPLWYIEAWRAYREATGDLPDLERRYATLTQIADHYAAGTRHGIAVDPSDGLLRAGDADTQITWMDARVDGRPVTPRAGKPVELNALWYNALMSLAELARLTGRSAEPYRGLAEQARAGFQRYLRPDGLGLYDVLDGPEGTDTRIRPNQILAVSLAHSPLAPADQAAVVRTVGARLLTSYGLRTLDPADPAYRAHYQGGVAERDSAYHQGPAWAWLLGHYALAVYRVSGDAASAQSLLEPIADHLADAGLGTVSELFDAEPPHTPRGAPSQAWSVAGTLMAWCQLARARPGAKEPSSE
jgi:4-alpha-glucanotransferase